MKNQDSEIKNRLKDHPIFLIKDLLEKNDSKP